MKKLLFLEFLFIVVLVWCIKAHPIQEIPRLVAPISGVVPIEHYNGSQLNYVTGLHTASRSALYGYFVWDSTFVYVPRKNTAHFHWDVSVPYVVSKRAESQLKVRESDYTKKGFHKGHIVAAADRSQSDASYHQTFVYTNCNPMFPRFNSGIWSYVEKECREFFVSLIEKEKAIVYVVKGCFETDKSYERVINLPVYKYYYMAFLVQCHETFSAFSFIVPHTNATYSDNLSKEMIDFVVPIDSIEQKAEIDLFPFLTDDVENRVEAHPNYSLYYDIFR